MGFIRIHFGPTSKIAAADIETYLLEKSRITFQLEIERNYHIFYQLMTDAYPKYWELCKLGDKPHPGDYFFLAQGVLTVAGMDDAEEMRATDTALDTLGFNQDQKDGLYKGTIAIAYIGNQKWKQKGREEQAEPDGMELVTKAAELLEIEVDWFVDTFMKPKLKVGKDFVKKGQNVDQVNFSVSATAKSLFARMFDWVVLLVNDSLDTPNPRKHFIGVLDIAGFEIFELNTLEQLLINYTNERLQQFFNHHMFVQEQEEYKIEGIQWAFVDFGMDLIVTIELIEKKMGILSMLEEECIVPKATDKTYLEKLMGKHLGKNPKFGKPKPAKKGKPEAHFELQHYAGTVGYNVTGWLFKNKDPVNEAVVNMMQESENAVVSLVFQEKDTGEKKKGSALMTISAGHRESLMKLMNNLHSTHPHFVRCIIPNEIKKSGHSDSPLIMHQLTCNGVLEGIRICQLGLPNKVMYPDFLVRYSIVAPKIFADGGADYKNTANKALLSVQMDPENFRTGHTKVMFRAGKLAELEDVRELALTKIILKMQCHARRLPVKTVYDTKKDEKKGLYSIQHNIRLYLTCKDWVWYQFYTMVKGETEKLKKRMVEEERKKQMAEGLAKFQAMLDNQVAQREAAQSENVAKVDLIASLKAEIEGLGTHALEQAEEIKTMTERADAATKTLADTEAYVASERSSLQAFSKKTKEELNKQKANVAAELAAAKAKCGSTQGAYQSLKNKAIAIEAERTAMKGEIEAVAEAIARVDKKATANLREKRESWQAISDIQSDVTTCVARASYLEKEGFEVDQDHLGALVKMHYKLHSYITYKVTKGKKIKTRKVL